MSCHNRNKKVEENKPCVIFNGHRHGVTGAIWKDRLLIMAIEAYETSYCNPALFEKP